MTACGVVVPGILAAPAMTEAQASGPGPLEQRANRDTPDNPVPRRTRFAAPQNPAVSSRPLIVELRVTLDERGRVGEVRPLGEARETYSFYISRPMGGETLAFMPILEAALPKPDYQAFVTSAMDAVKSIPLLDNAATEAVMQWVFTPTLLNGKPVPVVVVTTLQFTLMP
jgi:hypothetical protein